MKALVTGAGNGIGRAIAHRLAADGAEVVAVDLDGEAAAATAKSVGGRAVCCDISDEAAVASMAESVGALDILVNNAGIWRSHTLAESTLAEMEQVLRTNVLGSWLVTRALVPKFGRAGGAIVNLASVVAITGAEGRGAYSASKAGIIALTRQMASEYAPLGIRVNAVGPGLIVTEGTSAEFGHPGVQQAIGDALPLGRLGRPDDIAAVVSFFAAPAAGYVTGQTLFVDGGWTVNGSAFIATAVQGFLAQLAANS
ncbi:SDR family oxidoreductase [Nocardia sp. NBC_01503]|uniref:SDR family NAD(P)-dependent oxidoreductase n=1 Tax=Nocardia sp. NBC_01503 TaxID=2975997 RepID=UPI002E7C081C|nr:SDR family NAD(P)-dependent oxidoreductase [Nocardia sp. NBC_01503]WTL31549.1 SDR family oxidoreductase [Nocardia sp. NBC_01503]